MGKKKSALEMELLAANEKLIGELKDAKNGKDIWYEKYNQLNKEMEQIHIFLDALPNPIKRKPDCENQWLERPVLTRLCAWLATNK